MSIRKGVLHYGGMIFSKDRDAVHSPPLFPLSWRTYISTYTTVSSRLRNQM